MQLQAGSSGVEEDEEAFITTPEPNRRPTVMRQISVFPRSLFLRTQNLAGLVVRQIPRSFLPHQWTALNSTQRYVDSDVENNSFTKLEVGL